MAPVAVARRVDVVPPAPRAALARADHRFYLAMSAAIMATVFLGFSRTYFLRPYFQTTPLRVLAQLHGLIFSAWVCLFAVQATLAARRRLALHRRLGVAGAVLAAAVVAMGTTIAIETGRRNLAAGATRALSFLAVPLGDMVVFLILTAAAIWYRARPETHKRLILLATISITDAAIARWPFAIFSTSPNAFFVVTDVFVAIGPLYDLVSRRRIHPAYMWGALLIVLSQPLRLALAHTDAWLAFARALLQ